ncbi:ion channel POLLUX-like 2 [Pyrus ussuriensis x Pyrus communis]|uniref:Ion channel POLLUX-like 2 n=1 Tax=Pyrus ussuriensis x Pyrus communis TaxID=2448454 RepID=A0A5N5GUA0_9ROSA|nr:ion channel POLLUX-like 2 [Pyrus ussuriensis x Pyrus communis]
MSKFPHETKDFNTEFHRWYNMEPPPIPRLPKANPTSSFSFVRGKLDYETGVAEYWNHNLMKVEKELVDLNGEANEAHIESYEHFWEGNVEMEEERNKGFEDSHQLVKRTASTIMGII